MQYSKKRIQPLVDKYHINIESETFQQILTLFSDSIVYQVWAIKAYYSGFIDISKLKEVKTFIDEYPFLISSLPKHNITAYVSQTDVVDLIIEMEGARRVSIVRSVLNLFNPRQKRLSYDALFTDKTIDYKKWGVNDGEEAKIYYLLSQFKFADNRNILMTRISATTSFEEIFEIIEDGLSYKYDWNKKSLCAYIEANKDCKGTKIVYDKDNIVILLIPNYKASHAIGNGRVEWCIVTDSSRWDSYAVHGNGIRVMFDEKPKCLQYFLFDFSLRDDRTDSKSMIAFTIDSNTLGIYANERNKVNNTATIKDYLFSKGIRIDTLFKSQKSYFIWSYYNIKQSLLKSNIEIIDDNESNVIYCLVQPQQDITSIIENDKIAQLINRSKLPSIIRFDANKLADDADSIHYFMYEKSVNEIVSIQYSYDKYLKNINADKIATLITVKYNYSNPKVLYYYITSKDEVSALALLRQNPNINVNALSENEIPFCTAIENEMYLVAKTLIWNKNFSYKIDMAQSNLLIFLLLSIRKEKLFGNQKSVWFLMDVLLDMINDDRLDVNQKDETSETALHVTACRSSMNDVLNLLLKWKGIDVNATTDDGLSPYAYALKNHNLGGADMIMNHPSFVMSENDRKYEEQYFNTGGGLSSVMQEIMCSQRT